MFTLALNLVTLSRQQYRKEEQQHQAVISPIGLMKQIQESGAAETAEFPGQGTRKEAVMWRDGPKVYVGVSLGPWQGLGCTCVERGSVRSNRQWLLLMKKITKVAQFWRHWSSNPIIVGILHCLPWSTTYNPKKAMLWKYGSHARVRTMLQD